jgi:hypothetical protein
LPIEDCCTDRDATFSQTLSRFGDSDSEHGLGIGSG